MATKDPRLARPEWRGRTNIDAITIQALEAAEALAGFRFEITQGSYQSGAGDPKSAGTHDLGGVIDIRARGLDNARRAKVIRSLRRIGFAAWLRTPDQGDWPEHIHAVLIDHPRLAASAARQVTAYRNGRNGLANNGPDDGPRISPIPVYRWKEPDYMATDAAEKKLDAILAELRKLARAEAIRAERERNRYISSTKRIQALAAQVRAGGLTGEELAAKLDQLLELEAAEAAQDAGQ